VLRLADTVLHDDLVSREILSLIPATTALRNVGKRCGAKTITQEQLSGLMIDLARRGEIVVRLKSGDPLLFGRACEEIEALRRACVDYEIVPGITSALGAASALDTPLTCRGISSAILLLAAHRADDRDDAAWQRLVRCGATLAIYMPGDFRELRDRLLGAGLDPDTPCAIVSRATTSTQQNHATTIANLGHAAELAPPTVVLVGEVLRASGAVAVAPSADELARVAVGLCDAAQNPTLRRILY
jgi:uroporphyrin-III C-methyltransferase